MLRFVNQYQIKTGSEILFISPHLHDVIAAEAAKHGLPPGKIVVKNAKRNEVPALLSLSNYFYFIKPCYSKIIVFPY